MKYFFPDSQDFVDPSFDFEDETRSIHRVRQRDDLYPHEVFESAPYDGILVSKSIVDRGGAKTAKYTLAQRRRFFNEGVRRFFRLDRLEQPIETMGDCGAFSYIREEEPVWSVDEVIEFYELCGYDYGISVDHVILDYKPAWDETSTLPGFEHPAAKQMARQQLTLDLAAEFLTKSKSCGFSPIGVAQGWSPKSYARAVSSLQKMGFRRIALGGMVPLRTPQIMEALEAVSEVTATETKLHLLGVTRLDRMSEFKRFGVHSFDSTSPLMQALKDAKDNYYTVDGETYAAIRVPQVAANTAFGRRVQSGAVDGRQARVLERQSLDALAAFDAGKADVEEVVDVLVRYEELHGNPGKSYKNDYMRVLTATPWKDCSCAICRELGIHVILFRGAERNRRRGFHNIRTTYRRLKSLELVSG